ncbi:MAG: family M23B peptidase [Bacteroidetes bacterium HLUCCA01]|nr:MAG: family M23B peptidase [Bacteroidetes bacterium HLUCCA01]
MANTEVLLTIRSSNPADDVRLKPGQTPQPEVDTIALTQLLTQLTVTLDYPHIAVFAALDSTGSQWEYGYTNLTFHQDVLAQAGGKSRPFLYTRVNEDGFMVVVTAMLPDTPSARLNFRRYLNVHTPQEVQSGQHRLKRSHPSTGVQTTCGSEGWFDCAILTVMTDGTVVIECWPRICVEAQRLDNDWEGGGGSTGGSGGGLTEDPPCVSDPLGCLPGGDSSIPSQQDCSGVRNGTAFWDPVCPGRCVGGDTDRLPAKPGDDCNNLNIPCAGDVVKNPDITSPGNSGKTGGRFRPCIGASCPDELKAVRESGTKAHHGTDISCTEGEPLYAPFDIDNLTSWHQVDNSGWGYGNFIRGWTTIDGIRYSVGFAHLQQNGRATGSLKKGDIVGYCGRSGINDWLGERRGLNITTHVHMEMGTKPVFVRANRDSNVNPEPFLATRFESDSDANPLNQNPCNQFP